MGSDLQAIQGMWKVVSIRRDGTSLSYAVTHWEFDGDRVQEIGPHSVDGNHWATFALDPSTTPKRIDTTHQHINRDGETVRRTHKECYTLDGDTLQIGGSPIFGEYPKAISEAVSVVKTLSRYSGPRPRTKQVSGKTPRENPILGRLIWNDSLDQWEATIELLPNHTVSISFSSNDQGDEQSVAFAQAFVEWVKPNQQNAREYAAREMAADAEEGRDSDMVPDKITTETFAERITLTEITIEADGAATLWYDDDDMFGGHAITVSLNASREFTGAEMVG